MDRAVIGDHDRQGCIELAKAAQHPVLAGGLVLTFDAHGTKELLGDLDLAFAMGARIVAVAAKLSR